MRSFGVFAPQDDVVAAQQESDPRLLGGVGRVGAGRDGFVHLRAGARSRHHGALAAIGNRRRFGTRRLLRQCAVRVFSRRMGTVDGVGTGG